METKSAEHAQESVQLLWTGGWDSSFRLMQLLLIQQRPVQPIYVLNVNRRSAMIELQTMERLRDGLLARMDDPARLRPTMIVVAQQFRPGPEQRQWNNSIRETAHVGGQYVMLAGVAEGLGWHGVEMCIESRAEGRTARNRLVFADDRGNLSDAPEAQLFKYWSFPVIHLTKGEMAEIAKQHGFYDLLVQRWFCHHPVLGKPCGRCHPCEDATRDAVTFAHPAVVFAGRALNKARSVLAGTGVGPLDKMLRRSGS